ncbi:hypothetical protein COY52_05040, partial [Candidatus Desantisbacteria bacterium CG_4_10_14_0_8_um_filter_48_22]
LAYFRKAGQAEAKPKSPWGEKTPLSSSETKTSPIFARRVKLRRSLKRSRSPLGEKKPPFQAVWF